MKAQHVPREVARFASRLLARPNDALATVLGIGVLLDTGGGSWDDEPLRQRGIVSKPASDFLREQAQQVQPTH